MTAHSGDGSRLQYELDEEEWEAMTSDRTKPKRRQRYFMEFRERIYWYWQKGGQYSGNDYKVDGSLD